MDAPDKHSKLVEIHYLNSGKIEMRPINRTLLTWMRREAKKLSLYQSIITRSVQITRIH